MGCDGHRKASGLQPGTYGRTVWGLVGWLVGSFVAVLRVFAGASEVCMRFFLLGAGTGQVACERIAACLVELCCVVFPSSCAAVYAAFAFKFAVQVKFGWDLERVDATLASVLPQYVRPAAAASSSGSGSSGGGGRNSSAGSQSSLLRWFTTFEDDEKVSVHTYIHTYTARLRLKPALKHTCVGLTFSQPIHHLRPETNERKIPYYAQYACVRATGCVCVCVFCRATALCTVVGFGGLSEVGPCRTINPSIFVGACTPV